MGSGGDRRHLRLIRRHGGNHDVRAAAGVAGTRGGARADRLGKAHKSRTELGIVELEIVNRDPDPGPLFQLAREQLTDFAEADEGDVQRHDIPLLRWARPAIDGPDRARTPAVRSGAGAIQSDAQYAVDSTNRWRLSRWRRRSSATRSFGHFSRSTLIFEIDSRR